MGKIINFVTYQPIEGTHAIREHTRRRASNKVAHDLFEAFDTTQIIGNIDFCVAVPRDNTPALWSETEYLLWAECKRGTKSDIYASFTQLILTIGKARTFDKFLPPAFLGAFDAEKMGFIAYSDMIDVFYMNDFNWNVTPSAHETHEFQLIYNLVRSIIERQMLLFRYDSDGAELRTFIQRNFVFGKSGISKVRINKNNFTHIYQKWRAEVRPTIGIDWNAANEEGLIDADFYLADILSEHNISLKEKLFVLLRSNHYVYNVRRKRTGAISYDEVNFNDGQKAHTQFWNRYDRPPRREWWDYIVERRDLLVPQDVRERKGSFFTPQQWVELSQQYIADELGENWQDEYYVWDCAAGTGNLLNGLTNKYNIYASTIDSQDVQVMCDLASGGKINLLDSHIFQFDFLNDSFDKLPQSLQNIINDDEQRKKLLIYINPPYAEASNARTIPGTGSNRQELAKSTMVYKKYQNEYSTAARELFAQFFIRINSEIPSCLLAEFSTLKILQASNFRIFRQKFRAKLGRNFIVPASSFDNVRGQFPIGFFIWHLDKKEAFTETKTNVYNSDGSYWKDKNIHSYDETPLIIEWLRCHYDKANPAVAYLRMVGTDVQNNKGVFITNCLSENDLKKRLYTHITANNVIEASIYAVLRKVITPTWLNDRDNFLYPDKKWEADSAFQADCLAYALFSNNIQSAQGTNHWIPFTEEEVGAKERFESHFMTDFIKGKKPAQNLGTPSLFGEQSPSKTAAPIVFSPAAAAVIDAGRDLWRYYHACPDANPNASFYDIRLYFQGQNSRGTMNNDSTDAHYTQLIGTLRTALKVLAKEIEPKVYEYGFLKQ